MDLSQVVGNDDSGLVASPRTDRFHDSAPVLGIKGACRFIENKNRSVPKASTSEGDTLSLTT
jgi:hypothetical protein